MSGVPIFGLIMALVGLLCVYVMVRKGFFSFLLVAVVVTAVLLAYLAFNGFELVNWGYL